MACAKSMNVVALLLLCCTGVFATRLRATTGAGKAPCDKTAGMTWAMSLAAHKHTTGNATAAKAAKVEANVYFDGFSRYGCEHDASPAAQRIYFKEHACGEVASCRLLELGMTPRLCFDFCRSQVGSAALPVKFFGIEHGRDCYCATYITADSTGGGDCSLLCEGDQKESCGGKTKSSVFEMHLCGDSVSEADAAATLGEESSARCDATGAAADGVVKAARELGMKWAAWDFCSVNPGGVRVCAQGKTWTDGAAEIEKIAAESNHAADVVNNHSATLAEAVTAAEGDTKSAAKASAMELGTDALRKVALTATGAAAVTEMAVRTQAGTLGKGSALANFGDIYTALGDVEKQWNAICALVPITGQSVVAPANASAKEICGNHCLGLSTGVDACVGFNFQELNGYAACQMLKAEGLVEPKGSIAMAVPIFEVSDSKKTAAGFDHLGCYIHGAFLHGHKKGTLKTEVIREVTA